MDKKNKLFDIDKDFGSYIYFENKSNIKKNKEIRDDSLEIQILKREIDKEQNICLFCGKEKNTKRKCCSPECYRLFKQYSDVSISSLMIKKILKLPLNKKIEKLNEIASSSNLDLLAVTKYFISFSRKLGSNKNEIGITLPIAEYYSIEGKIPDFVH